MSQVVEWALYTVLLTMMIPTWAKVYEGVTFKGGYHPATGELCLLRCAEVCLEEGFSFFEVVDSETGSSLEGHGSTYPFDQHYPARDRFMDDVPFVAKTIRMLKKKSDQSFAYNAKEIKSSLRRKYKVK